MQAVFDFADQPVDWDEDIYPYFECLGDLKIPWRWRLAGAPELGEWLDMVRKLLSNGEKILLTAPLPNTVRLQSVDLADFKNQKRLNFFYDFLRNDESVIAIHSGNQQSKNKTHKLAQSLSGKFSSIEEVEGKDLFRFVKKLESSTAKERLLSAIDFSKKCFNSVDGLLAAATKRGERASATKATHYPNILHNANNYLASASSENLSILLMAIKDNPKTTIYRRDLFYRLMCVLRLHVDNGDLSLINAANQYQREFRQLGRPIRHAKLIGTTLLVKGLEYQHAIILEAESLSSKELYVALTRGAKTITIVTRANAIPA